MNTLSRWERAVALSEAWRQLAPINWLDALRNLEAKANLTSAIAAVAVMLERGDNRETLAISQQFTEHAGIGHAMQRDLANRLQTRDFVAYGFATPRRPQDQPVQIPTDVWSGKINWLGSEVVGSGLHFVSVRVLPSSPISEDALPAAPPSLSKVGRPGVAEFVEEAFAALVKAGAIDPGRPKVRAYEAIRAWLSLHHPDWEDISDKTLQRHTAPLFKALKVDKT